MLGLFKPDPSRDELQAARAEFDALELIYGERVERMRTYRAEGNRARDGDRGLSREDRRDYGRSARADTKDVRHNIPLPLGKALTVKHAFRIAGVLPDVVVDQRDESPQERYRSDAMEKIVWAIIRASGDATPLAAASWNASEVGAGCFDLYMDYKRNIPVFRSVDPAGIYEVPGVDDPHDFQRVYRTWDSPLASVQNEYRGKSFRGEPIPVSDITPYRTDGGVDMVRIVQCCDKERIVRFATGGAGSQVVGLFEYQHDYGFVPYVVIPNLGPYEDIWGWADYEFVRALTEYLPIMLSREADVLRAVANGAYVDEGTGQAAQTVQDVIRQGGVLPAKTGGRVSPIEVARMPDFAETHADRVTTLIKWLGFAPDAAWGEPGSGSGTDRGLQLQPLMEYTAMKQLNWQRGLSRLSGMALQMLEKKMIGTSTYRGVAHSGKTRRRIPFSFTLGPEAPPDQMAVDTEDQLEPGGTVELPRTPNELFDGEYDVRFVWRNRIDPDDPAYVLSEVNKHTAGLQSLETTLENLGFQAPEDEMRRIEKEAKRFPWVNQGLVTLILGQIRGNAQGSGGGAPPDMGGALAGALETMGGIAGGGQSGALDADAMTSALGPRYNGLPSGQA